MAVYIVKLAAVGGLEPPEQRAVHRSVLCLWFVLECGCIATSQARCGQHILTLQTLTYFRVSRLFRSPCLSYGVACTRNLFDPLVFCLQRSISRLWAKLPLLLRHLR